MDQIIINPESQEILIIEEGWIEPSSTFQIKKINDLHVDYLEISVRASNALKEAGIKTVGELILLKDSEILRMKNVGKLTLKEIKEELKPYRCLQCADNKPIIALKEPDRERCEDKKMTNTNTMLNTKQAAEYLGLAPVTLEAWRVQGGGPVYIKLGKAVRYCKSDINDFIEKNKKTNTGNK